MDDEFWPDRLPPGCTPFAVLLIALVAFAGAGAVAAAVDAVLPAWRFAGLVAFVVFVLGFGVVLTCLTFPARTWRQARRLLGRGKEQPREP